MTVPAAELYGLALVLLRSLGLALALPALGDHTIPARVRVVAASALGIAAFAAVAPAPGLPADVTGLLGDVLRETAVGLSAGLTARLAASVALGAGSFIGMSMGLGFGALADPSTGVSFPVVARLLEVLAVGVAVGLGLHGRAAAWLIGGLVAHPVGTPFVARELVASLIGHALGGIALSVQLALPAVAAVTVGHVIMGLLNRAAPQINLSSVGFSIAIVAGGAALYLTTPTLTHVVGRQVVEVLTRSLGG